MSFSLNSRLSRFSGSILPSLGALLALGAVPLACSVTATPIPLNLDFDGGITSDSGPLPTNDAGGNPGTDAAPHPDSGPPACPADPSCGFEICDCTNGGKQATGGICRSGGACDLNGACAKACGGPSGGAEVYQGCSSAAACSTGQPFVNCQCTAGAWVADATCTPGGFCSGTAQDVCPGACAQQGSGTWAGCGQDADCDPIICACNDGTRPVDAPAVGLPTGHCLANGACLAPSSYCPNACTAHGGWNPPTVPDAGMDSSTGGNPGDPCTDASQCNPLSCTCTDGMTFSGNRVCDDSTMTCSTQASACGLICFNDGGWSGHYNQRARFSSENRAR